jgi:hypothetical protein
MSNTKSIKRKKIDNNDNNKCEEIVINRKTPGNCKMFQGTILFYCTIGYLDTTENGDVYPVDEFNWFFKSETDAMRRAIDLGKQKRTDVSDDEAESRNCLFRYMVMSDIDRIFTERETRGNVQ